MLALLSRTIHSRRVRLGDRDIKGLLVDIDGVLYVGGHAIEGATEVVNRLDVPYIYLTNTTTRSLSDLVVKLQSLGFPATPEQILSAPGAALHYLRSKGSPPARLVVSERVAVDFVDYPQSARDSEVVVLGDIGEAWDYGLMNQIFRSVVSGAELVALHRNRFWQTTSGLQLDIGAFVAGLEYSTGKSATVVGKPSREFFEAGLSRLGLQAKDVAMIGDDIESDVGGAQALGMLGVLVRTGKYRAEWADHSTVVPDLTLDSIASLLA